MDGDGMKGGRESVAEAAQVAHRRSPAKLPTKDEVRTHHVSHLPFRDWCEECAAGRRHDWPHRTKSQETELSTPEVHMDYCFVREGDSGEHHCSCGVEWGSEQVVRDLRKFEIHGGAVFRTHPELALSDFVRQVCQPRPSSRSCLTHPGVREAKGSWFVEQAVQWFEGVLRTHKVSLGRRIGQSTSRGHLAIAWPVDHSVDVLNWY